MAIYDQYQLSEYRNVNTLCVFIIKFLYKQSKDESQREQDFKKQ